MVNVGNFDFSKILVFPRKFCALQPSLWSARSRSITWGLTRKSSVFLSNTLTRLRIWNLSLLFVRRKTGAGLDVGVNFSVKFGKGQNLGSLYLSIDWSSSSIIFVIVFSAFPQDCKCLHLQPCAFLWNFLTPKNPMTKIEDNDGHQMNRCWDAFSTANTPLCTM